MIGRLRGELIQKLPNLALVECGGVGYAAAISLSTYGLLPEVGATVVLHTELLVRENEIALLGFSSQQERELYRLLIKVDGVGPKLALAALPRNLIKCFLCDAYFRCFTFHNQQGSTMVIV